MGTSITQSIAPIARQLAGEERSVIGRIKDVSADVDNIKQPTPPTQPPPPKQPEQEPFLGFGSAATGLMVLASAFTRAPLVNALNAATAGMNAARAKKTTDFQNAYAEWKQQVDYAMKLHTYEQDAYKNAIDKAKVSIDGAKAEATVLAHSFKDQAAVALLERGDWAGFRSLVGGRGKLGTSLQTSTADLKTQVQQFQTLGYVVKAIKGEDPKAAAAGIRAWSAYLIADEHGKGDTASERKKTTDDAIRYESLAQDLESGDPERVKVAKAEALRMIGSQAVASKGETPKGDATISDEAAHTTAEQLLAGDNSGLQNWGRGSQGAANLTKIREIWSTLAKEKGLTGADLAAAHAAFASALAGARTIGTAGSRIDIGAKELEVALPQALELSRDVWRSDFKPLTSIQQALQGNSSDPDLIEFQQQNQAVINAYAQTMSRGGVPTVAAAQRASELLSTATGPEAYERQLDRLNKEVQQMKFGTDQAKQDLLDSITGRHTKLQQPKLTGVEQPGASAPAAGPEIALPPAARAQLQEGHVTTFGNGQRWKLQNGQPVQVQ